MNIFFSDPRNHTSDPWLVEDFHDFYFLCCPECAFKSKDALAFFDHAIENHPKSRVHVFSEPEHSYEAPDTYNRFSNNTPATLYTPPTPNINDRVHYNTPASSIDSPVTYGCPTTPATPDTPDTHNRVLYNTLATLYTPTTPNTYNWVHYNTPASFDTYGSLPTPVSPDTPDTYQDTSDTYLYTNGKFRRNKTHTDRISRKLKYLTNHEQYSSVHEEMKLCELKASKPLKLVWSLHERKKQLQCDECEMLKTNHKQNYSVHEEMKPCEPKTSKPLKLVGSVHEEKKLKEEEMENAGEALASESDLKLHKSAPHEEKKHKKRYI